MRHMTLRDVSFSYPRSATPAVDGVTASFAGRTVAVLGPNGAGKTTLFRLLTTVGTPAAGSIQIGELDLARSRDRERLRREIGVMPQHLPMMGGYRCADFLRYVCWLRRVPSSMTERSVSDALDVVGLVGVRDQKIKTLSGGMRQRLGLAQVFVASPRLVVLDEPTVGLDPAQRVEFRSYLSTLRERCTIVFATHLVDDVAALAEEVLILSRGRCVFAGRLDAFAEGQNGRPVSGADVESAFLAVVPREGA